MTPPARIAAAVEILDRVLAGDPAEETLIRWARQNRYAGSGDRQAVRDLVFEALRCRRSFAALGGGETGRGLMIGRLRARGSAPDAIFTGQGYGPALLTDAEVAHRVDLSAQPEGVRLDLPDWLLPDLRASLGPDLDATAEILKTRAPLGLRVNVTKANHEMADAALRADGIESARHPLARTARIVTANPRRVARSAAYLDGLVEVQDPASQAVVEALAPFRKGMKILDYCAGGGGKALAIAAATGEGVAAHDAVPERMADIAPRAARAGAEITVLAPGQAQGRWDLVLVDAPCSGSGAWRRHPDAKWRLTSRGLEDLRTRQSEILDRAAGLVAPNGSLAYVTCSLLSSENQAQIREFLDRATRPWGLTQERQILPKEGGDGFYLARLSPE